jgi:8-oxo-dGTP pyrophosphatase MutT (NUDIX family)
MINKEFIRERLIKGLTESEGKTIVGGVLIKAIKTGRVFLLLRNDKHPVWALVSGTIEKGENVLQGLKREVYEELFLRENEVNINFKFIKVEQVPEKNMEFHYYEGLTPTEFTPILDRENLNYDWFDKDKLPSPLFKGLSEKIAKI